MSPVAWASALCDLTSAKPKSFLDFCDPLVWNRVTGDLVSLRIYPALAPIKQSGEKARPGVFDDCL